ncbi:MAG TPA: class I adenylate-forming enzyme family protein [Gemmatirosa sp.]
MDGPTLPGVTARHSGRRLLDAALSARLRRGARPVLWGDDPSAPPVVGAEIWRDATAWAERLRNAGVGAGDRVVCALPPGCAFVAVLVAALGESWTLVPVPPAGDVDRTSAAVGARAVVAADGAVRVGSRAGAPTPDVRLLLATSGTTGAPRRLAISESNLRVVLDTHAGPLALEGSVMLSVLPWHHAFGLVLELLPALLGGAQLVRDPSGGRDVASMLERARAAEARGTPVTHLHAVPQTVRLLAANEGGAALLGGLRGGLVGGAPIDVGLAGALAATRMRVGYGQTEASPGICLGAPGAWRAGVLGTPVGCAVRVDADGVLAFRGPNACHGTWRDGSDAEPGALDVLDPDRWVRTGDLAVAERDGSYTFVGRAAESFKLENGRYVPPLPIEAALRARYPAVHDVVLSSADGISLVLAYAGDDVDLDADDVRPLLGTLAARPVRIVRVEPDAWARTTKGEIDRRFPTGRPDRRSG